MHTTNYFNTFIEIAEDCPTSLAEVPALKGDKKTVANLQFDMVIENPYKYTSDDVLFQVFAVKNNIESPAMEMERDIFFSKGQPCLRASPLTKRYGWGVHANEEGRIAIYGADSEEYKRLSKDDNLKHVKAMRSKRG